MPHSTLPGGLLASAILALVMALSVPAAPTQGPGTVTPDLTSYLLSSPAADAPLYKWQTVAAIPATNAPSALTITGIPAVAFYTVIASNQFGVSSNSNTVTPNAQAVTITIRH